MAAATFTLFALAVIATQYREGGSGEWGGRYFLVGIPVVVPVAVAALADVGDRLDRSARRAILGAAVVGSLAVTALAGLALFHKQWAGQRQLDVLEATATVNPDAAVVVTDGNTGRRAWRHVVAGEEWFLTDGYGVLEDFGDAIAAEQRPLVVSTLDEARATAALEDAYRLVDGVRPASGSTRAILTFVPR